MTMLQCYTYWCFLHIITQLPIHPATKITITVSSKPVGNHSTFSHPPATTGLAGIMLIDGERASVMVLALLSVMLKGTMMVDAKRVLAVFVMLSAGRGIEGVIRFDGGGWLIVGYTVLFVTDGMYEEQPLSVLSNLV